MVSCIATIKARYNTNASKIYKILSKMSGSESWGQEEAACVCVFRPMRPLQILFKIFLLWLNGSRFHTATQMFKSLHQISPPYLHKIFQFSREVTGHVSHNLNYLFVPRVFTNFSKRNFFYQGAVLGKSLPSNISEAATVPSFKNLYFNSNWFLFLYWFLFVI